MASSATTDIGHSEFNSEPAACRRPPRSGRSNQDAGLEHELSGSVYLAPRVKIVQFGFGMYIVMKTTRRACS